MVERKRWLELGAGDVEEIRRLKEQLRLTAVYLAPFLAHHPGNRPGRLFLRSPRGIGEDGADKSR